MRRKNLFYIAIIAIIATVATTTGVARQRACAHWEARVENAGLATGLQEAEEALRRAEEAYAVARSRAEILARRAP